MTKFMRKLYILRFVLAFFGMAVVLGLFARSAQAQGGTQLNLNPAASSISIGNSVVVFVEVASVTDFYGYQFKVTYDAAKVSAAGAFINTFFDTTSNTFIPSGWDASCASGICKFAATHLNTAAPVSGSGTLAQITFTGISSGTVPLAFAQDILTDRDGNSFTHTSGTAGIVVTASPGGAQLVFNPMASSVAIGNSVVVSIDLSSVTDLYGYQLQVTYDASRVSASGAFVNSFFDTTSNTFIPPGWNGACGAGVCKFAASHLNTASPISGAGTLAQITFTGQSAGAVPLAFGTDILSDRDGNPLVHTNGTGSILVYAAPPGSAQLEFNPASSSVAVGNNVVVSIDLANISNLYGYQFQVNYDASLVSASGAFVNSFFDTTTDTFIPPGWSASCAAGICKFAATHLNVASPLAGSGTLAQITFTGVSGGTVPLTFSANILADRDGNSIPHTDGTGTILVYGTATFSGTVQLQGRATPISTGLVTFTDLANFFPPTVVSFSAATGNFTATVPVAAGGSTYKLTASHSLYLRNELSGVGVSIGGSYPQATTILRGGDGTNDGVVSVLDLTCVGGNYGAPPALCAATGNSDLNEDGSVNILDLVLVGGNYGMTAPQPW